MPILTRLRQLVGPMLGMGLALVACAVVAADLLTPEERTWLAHHPRIVLGVGEDWAPSVVKDDKGRFGGFIFDHLQIVNRRLGTDIRIEAGPWHEMVAKAEAGAIDGLTLTAPLDERKARFVFSDVFMTVHDFIYLREGDAKRRDNRVGLSDLRGRRVGYLKGTLRISRVLAEYPGLTAVPADTSEELADRLLRGDVDAAVASYSFEYWRASHGLVGFGPAKIVPETEARMVMTIRRDLEPLAGIVNKGLAAIGRDELEALYRRWYGADYFNRTASPVAALTPEERAWLAQHSALRVGIDPEWAPVEFFDEAGVARGMSRAYLDRLATVLGVRFDVVGGPSWSDVLHRLGRRELDLLPAIAATPERREWMGFTQPYLSFPAVIFSAAAVAYLGGPEALKGRTVTAIRDEAVWPWLQQDWPELTLVPAADTHDALRKVASGEAYAFVGNLVTTSYYIGQSGLTQIKVAGETPFTYRLAMGVRGDWPILAGILQKGIDAIPAAERDAIYREWLSVRYEHAMDWSMAWPVLAAAALLLFAVFAERTWRLRAANARLKHLARELALVGEQERRRLAGELHDSPMQKLALAQLQFGAAERGADSESAERLATGLDLMREAIGELRSLQFEMSPPMLYGEGLHPTLRWLAAHASERSAVSFSLRVTPGAVPPVPQDVAVVLFQCARELVYNVARHASARMATIAFDVEDGVAVLAVEDDGRGFVTTDASAGGQRGGFGLASVRQRIALFGGRLSILSTASGTRVTVRMPLPEIRERADAPATAALTSQRFDPGVRRDA